MNIKLMDWLQTDINNKTDSSIKNITDFYKFHWKFSPCLNWATSLQNISLYLPSMLPVSVNIKQATGRDGRTSQSTPHPALTSASLAALSLRAPPSEDRDRQHWWKIQWNILQASRSVQTWRELPVKFVKICDIFDRRISFIIYVCLQPVHQFYVHLAIFDPR
jgi:hypothetical protein